MAGLAFTVWAFRVQGLGFTVSRLVARVLDAKGFKVCRALNPKP